MTRPREFGRGGCGSIRGVVVDLLTEVACQIFYAAGYTKTQPEWLPWKEKPARREVYRLLFAEEFLDVPGPLLLMTKCVRAGHEQQATTTKRTAAEMGAAGIVWVLRLSKTTGGLPYEPAEVTHSAHCRHICDASSSYFFERGRPIKHGGKQIGDPAHLLKGASECGGR